MLQGAGAQSRGGGGAAAGGPSNSSAAAGAAASNPSVLPPAAGANFLQSATAASASGSFAAAAAAANLSRREKQKLGHRRVDDEGQVTYKKRPTNEIMRAIQLGIQNSVGNEAQKPSRDLLTQDFGVCEIVDFPREGGKLTMAHTMSSFTFKTYAPLAFRHFRKLYNIDISQFLASICGEELEELSNPGASGSIFYRTADDNFIIKTVQHKEAKYLQRLLLQYYLTLTQNPRTLLPKFYGLYCYQCGSKNIRFVVMNNLLPSTIRLTEKYDLKGSTYKRQASNAERAKSSPTFKDLDFKALHETGLSLEADIYTSLIECISRDCLVLESFRIMDYSLLLGIYNLDQTLRERERQRPTSSVGAAATVGFAGGAPSTSGAGAATSASALTASAAAASASFDESDGNQQQQRRAGRGGSVEGLQRGWSLKKISVFNTPIESINAENTAPIDLHSDEMDITPVGGIPARNAKGERLFLYMGIIDILQNYRLFKKMEHAMKSIITDGDTVSVHNPRFYSERFQLYLKNDVFKKVESLDEPHMLGPNALRFRRIVNLAMKSAPSRRRAATRGRSSTIDDSGCLSGSDGLRPASMMAAVAVSAGLDDSSGSALSTVAAAALPQSQPAGAIDDRDLTPWDSATPRLLIRSGSHGNVVGIGAGASGIHTTYL
ncbi:hypothetical protein BOX15_Mlig000740g3 [Macrostomum lignano]|uniref:PIPK domain-containing protein n=2 Tax=Macrostomum lignano TaxID=282301 RepID=A0A267DJM0_9PLAT|nr:hypothetical protein BOX15_Mlig000740g3 [Macrostomum lignano]